MARLESEEHWRALSRKQAVFRSFLCHALVWTSVIWLAAKYTVPQFRDAGCVLIELHSRQQAPLAASAHGQSLTSPKIASARSSQATRRPSVLAKTPTIDSRRSIRVAAVRARHAAVIARAGSFVHMRQPGQSAPRKGPTKPAPAGATVASGLLPTPAPQSLLSSAGTHLSKNPGVMSEHDAEVNASSKFAEMDARACKLYFEGETLSAANPEKAMKNWSEALVIMQDAVPLLKREVGENHSEVAFATWNLGRCYEKTGDLDQAAKAYRESIRLEEQVKGRDSLQRAITLVHLSDVLKKQQKYDEAKTALLSSFVAYEKRFGVDSKEVTWSHTRLMDLEECLDQRPTPRPVIDWMVIHTPRWYEAPVVMPEKVLVKYAPEQSFYQVRDSEMPAILPMDRTGIHLRILNSPNLHRRALTR